MLKKHVITVRCRFAAAGLSLGGLSGGTIGSRVRLRGRLSGIRLHQTAVHDGYVRLDGALWTGPAWLADARVGIRTEPVARTIEGHVVARTLGTVHIRMDAGARFVDANL